MHQFGYSIIFLMFILSYDSVVRFQDVKDLHTVNNLPVGKETGRKKLTTRPKQIRL
jgi:hypothetical protein